MFHKVDAKWDMYNVSIPVYSGYCLFILVIYSCWFVFTLYVSDMQILLSVPVYSGYCLFILVIYSCSFVFTSYVSYM